MVVLNEHHTTFLKTCVLVSIENTTKQLLCVPPFFGVGKHFSLYELLCARARATAADVTAVTRSCASHCPAQHSSDL